MFNLRPYQREAIDSIYAFFREHTDPTRNPVIATPTASGKGVMIAKFCQEVLMAWPNQRIMMLTHVKELIEQNAEKIITAWPQAPLGIYSAGMGEKVSTMPITFAGIQSVARHPELFGRQDLILIDECHLVGDSETASYRKFIKAMYEVNPKLRIIGFSATPFRLGLGMITDGGVFTDLCYDITGLGAFNKLLDEGYLATLIPMSTQTVLDVSKVHKRGGEFIPQELQQAVARVDITHEALQEAVIAAKDRNHWLIFATGIDHVEMIVTELDKLGVSAVGIHSKMTSQERDANLDAFKQGRVRAMVNADILTTGFDYTALDCIILLRPTNSAGLHVQILGRGTRPHYAPGFDLSTTEGRLTAIEHSEKPNCLVLDFAGNTKRLGPINDPRIPKRKGEGTGDIPIKVCDACGCLAHISAKVCPNCDAEFQFVEKITAKASTIELIVRDEPLVANFSVDRVTYDVHVKLGFPPTLKVTYFCGLRRFSEWICLEHHGNPIQRKAHKWWRDRSDTEPPETVAESRSHLMSLRVPRIIRVWVNKKFPEILSVEF